jgi:hypothetical protein
MLKKITGYEISYSHLFFHACSEGEDAEKKMRCIPKDKE